MATEMYLQTQHKVEMDKRDGMFGPQPAMAVPHCLVWLAPTDQCFINAYRGSPVPYPRLVMVTQLHFNAAGNLMGFDYIRSLHH